MVLVTGGAGYVGSHYVMHERARGLDVVVLDNLSTGHREAVLDAPLVVGDLEHRPTLDRVFRQYPIKAVVHFAASASVGESVIDPGKYYRNNVLATCRLLDAMHEHGVRHLVFSSSCAVFGAAKRVPIDESQPCHPISPYGETKLACERMMGAYDRAHALRYTALRYFNAAGADPESRIGESHDPETHLVPLALQAALGKREPLTLFGQDYDTPDGTCIRDYVHVTDLARAHSLALERLRSGGESRSFNLGVGEGYSVIEVLQACETVSGRAVPRREGERRAGDPPRLVANAARAQDELGWRPQYTALEDTIRTAWDWERSPQFARRHPNHG